MMETISGKERRRFQRIRLQLPLHYQIRGTQEFNNALTKDISAGGIGFINDRFLAPGSRLNLEISILSRVLNLSGKISWSASLPHSDKYHLGIEFLESEPQEKKYLSDYIDMQLGKL